MGASRLVSLKQTATLPLTFFGSLDTVAGVKWTRITFSKFLFCQLFSHLCRGGNTMPRTSIGIDHLLTNEPYSHVAIFGHYMLIQLSPWLQASLQMCLWDMNTSYCQSTPPIKELVHFESVAPSFHHIHFSEQEAALWNGTKLFLSLTEETDIWFESVAFWNYGLLLPGSSTVSKIGCLSSSSAIPMWLLD